ncbi:hypothetical protein [Shimazuella kribbensis]|uniref:hypothetical protein n=1 Tax=Shimazuella kribbensis TaxID=139808 RepID=UPI0003F8C870|nr:hypothetical protein [Shimazuella kribbensis]
MSTLLTNTINPVLQWDVSWPTLSPLHLAFLELERDPHYDFLPAQDIEPYITKAIAIGSQSAKSYIQMDHLSFFNHVLKDDIRIHIRQQHPEHPHIRAQYNKKKQTIFIYKNSIQEVQTFLSTKKTIVKDIDVIALHAYHEWFHHLEETSIGRTDLHFPTVIIKQRGPFLVKRSLNRLREIAAHAFTQTALGLDWSPLLLDEYKYHFSKGRNKTQIRESFQNTVSTYYAIINKISD